MGSALEGTTPPLPRPRVLVVDDDESVRSVLRRVLASEGYDALEAADGEIALDLLRREGAVDLLLTDIHMPNRDGISLLQEVSEGFPDTAVVMLSGDEDLHTAVDCLTAGARDYLTKPVLIEEVRARLRKVLEQRRVMLEVRRFRERYQQDLRQQVAELSNRNQQMFLEQVQMAVTMLEAKDPYTRGHSQRVASYAVTVGERLGFDDDLLHEVRLGGELHDIGKIGTRDAVLNKPAALTAEEFSEIRRHTTDGERMLGLLRADHPEVLNMVRWHHERMDGSGFPDGLMGDRIPMSARLIAVVDAFDAMTSTRTYRRKQAAEDACRELERCRGTQFDDAIVSAFLTVYRDNPSAFHHE